MARARRRVLICSLVVCALALPAATPAQAGSPTKTIASKINKFRAAHGLRKLRVSNSLNRSSYRYARTMARRHYFGHASSIRASGSFSMLGEVLAMHSGSRARPSQAVNGWKRSAVHRRVLLHPSFRYIGAGRARGGGKTMWVVQVGRR